MLKAKSVVWMLGSITSRLAADTTTVSDQICLNINVIARSLTQAAMVLIFMVNASWRLTVVTFIMLPSTLFICRLYGSYFRCSHLRLLLMFGSRFPSQNTGKSRLDAQHGWTLERWWKMKRMAAVLSDCTRLRKQHLVRQ